MCLDNATFLAERMVAACQKSTNALYLLAVCHYRSGKAQKALSVLDDVKLHTPCTKYLTAKCCYDLEQYGRAEEALLEIAREEYKNYKLSCREEPLMTMDEWVLQMSPNPIPNGAAGLYLLGNTCRKSNRKHRAMDYYRMSLKVRKNAMNLFSFKIFILGFLTIILSSLPALNFSLILSCGLVTRLFAKWVPLTLIPLQSLASGLNKWINCTWQNKTKIFPKICHCKKNPCRPPALIFRWKSQCQNHQS
jgi:hypothetical protein